MPRDLSARFRWTYGWTHLSRPLARSHVRDHKHHTNCQGLLIYRPFVMRMRGLEPPPGCPDTDLNRAVGVQMRPAGSRSSISSGFLDASDASDAMTVAKLLPRRRAGSAVQTTRRRPDAGSPVARADHLAGQHSNPLQMH